LTQYQGSKGHSATSDEEQLLSFKFGGRLGGHYGLHQWGWRNLHTSIEGAFGVIVGGGLTMVNKDNVADYLVSWYL
jgi:hypothetical protein